MQQLILLILVALLVGLAIVTGIRMSGETMHQVNEYEVAQEAIMVASYAQAWYRKPVEMGGGGGSFLNLTLATLPYDSLKINSRFEMSEKQAESFRLTGVGVEGSPLHVTLVVFADSISQMEITR